MPKSDSQWKTVSLTPLVGELDVRSRPSDVVAGGFRMKLNFEVTPEGKLQRRAGFSKAFDGPNYTNQDHHRQGFVREALTFGFEFTAGDDSRTLYDGTQSRISRLNATTGVWTDIVIGKGAPGAKWSAATLQDQILFVNDVDEPLLHDSTTITAAPITTLQGLGVKKAKVVVAFAGVLMIMNVTGDVGVPNKRFGSRIYWSNLNAPTEWAPGDPASVAGMQDLPYGDDILAAMPLLGALYIFTRRGIWRCVPNGSTAADVFLFTQVYTEPQNQAGCLAYPYTLTSTGGGFNYMGRDGIYSWDPYIPAPIRQEWIHKASGFIYKKIDTAMSGKDCNLPISIYSPERHELWFSWPIANAVENGISLVLALDWRTADVVDHGFSVFRNFRLTPTEGLCNEDQEFLGVSTYDNSWKNIGHVFYRELISGAGFVDLPPTVVYSKLGYYSQLIGMIPLGLYDREKTLRNVLVDDEVTEEAHPPFMKLRIGNSYQVCDPTDLDDVCAPEWRETIPPYSLACPDNMKISAMKEKGLKPSIGREFPVYEQNRNLYFDLRIEGPPTEQFLHSPPVGGDIALNRLDFDCRVSPKP